MLRLIRSLAPALLLSACGTPLLGGSDDDSLFRLMWERQGIDDYRYVYSAICFCPERGPVQVTVRDNRVVEVQSTQPGDWAAGGVQLPVLTVDELFDLIDEAEENDTYTKVEYHPRLGYPTSAEIGTLANDAGTLYLISDLVRLD
jgi:hypothetical protein